MSDGSSINETRNDQESRMSEQTYNIVFEHIRGTLVPKTQLEESQNKSMHLESMLKKVTAELEKEKSESRELKQAIGNIQAEKDSLQAEKQSLEAEKRALEVKFNEISLKLKNTGTRKIKEEPGIGIVNVPASTSSRPQELASKFGRKRQNATKNNSQENKVKRKKIGNSDNSTQNTRKSTVRKICLCNMSF